MEPSDAHSYLPGNAKESQAFEPLPAIVIPDKVIGEILSARSRISKQYPNAKAVILLERSAPILYEGVRPDRSSIDREIRISIGREISQRYTQSHPDEDLQIVGEHTLPESTVTPAQISRYVSWLETDPIVQRVVQDLAGKLKNLGVNRGDEVLCVDDVIDTGLTALTFAYVVQKSTEQIGYNSKVTLQGNKSLHEAIRTTQGTYSENELNVSMIILLKNNNWLHDIVDASFSTVMEPTSDLYAGSSPQNIATMLFLYETMKGSIKNPDSSIIPLTRWEQYEEIGNRFLSQRRGDVSDQDLEFLNPALALEARFGKKQLMQLHHKLMQALSNIN